MLKKLAIWVLEKRKLPRALRESFAEKTYPAILNSYEFEMDYYGLRYSGNTKNQTDRMFFILGGVEKYLLAMLKDYITSSKTENISFLDIGANSGWCSLFVSKYIRKIHAFEPNQVARNSFLSNIFLNNIKNIMVHNVGLGDSNEILPFYIDKNFGSTKGSFVKQKDSNYYVDTEIKKGDDIISEYNIKNVGILRIDAAGYERKILQGFTDTIERFRPLVVIDISGQARKSFGSGEDFESSFPDNYYFYQFSGVSDGKETYKLKKFDYNLQDNSYNVIAVPGERVRYIKSFPEI